MADPVIYTDDPDAFWTFTVKSADGSNVDWASPVVAIGSAGYTVTGTWIGSPSATRKLSVPLVGLTVGLKTLYLRVPSGTDIKLGAVTIRTRS